MVLSAFSPRVSPFSPRIGDRSAGLLFNKQIRVYAPQPILAFVPQCVAHPPHNASWSPLDLSMKAPARAPPPLLPPPLTSNNISIGTGVGTTAPPPSHSGSSSISYFYAYKVPA